MLDKLKPIHFVLIGLGLLAIGTFLGSQWSKWFPSSTTPSTQRARLNCGSSESNPNYKECCRRDPNGIGCGNA